MKLDKFRTILVFTLILVTFIFNSCFEIIEEINLNPDGSGTFCYTINLSQSKMQINSMLLLDSVNGRKVPKRENISEVINKAEFELKKDSLLSEIIVKRNWDDYIFSISGKFENIEALNHAINQITNLYQNPENMISDKKVHYSYSNKVFTRLYDYDLKKDYETLPEKDKLVFENAEYTTIYRFSSSIGVFSNPSARVSKSGKAILLKVGIKDLVTNSKTIKNSINLK